MVNIGAVSYVTGGLAFLVLTILLITSWRGRLHGALVVATSVTSTIWCFVLAYNAGTSRIPLVALFTLEAVRDGVWLTLLLALLGAHARSRTIPQFVTLAAHSLWIGVLFYIPIVHFGLQPTRSASAGSAATILGPLVLALAGLVLVEQLYRNTRPEKRWAIQLLCLGAGGLFAYDLFLYSQGLLLRQINADVWNARGVVNALVVPLVAVSVARNPEWSLRIFVSRHIVFYTASLIGAGIYLLAMAVGGYYVRVYGGSWGNVAQIVFLFSAGLLLLVIMFSSQVRAALRVFLAKHFYRNKYDYREEWLRLIETLATPTEEIPLRERTIKALAQIMASPGGGLWLRHDGKEFRPVAHWNVMIPDSATENADSPLVSFLQERQWIIDIREYTHDHTRYPNLTLPGWFDALDHPGHVIPLLQEDKLLGFIVLARADQVRKLTWEDTDLLKTAGRQVASYLGQHEAAQLLAEAKQFDAFNRLTAFIMHDLKNLIAQQSLVVRNASKHKDNPAFIADAISTIDNSVARMNQLLTQLKHGELQGPGQTINLSTLLARLIEECKSRKPVPTIESADEELHAYAVPEGLAMVLGHTLRNAQDATQADGYVRIHLKRAGQTAMIEITDNGCGMEAAFLRDRLFRPFDTTKGSRGMGIGAYQAREMVRAMGGDVEVRSEAGKGTTFRITLPLFVDSGASRGQERAKVTN
jgi:putative PEP-CTERM system histidine kinase